MMVSQYIYVYQMALWIFGKGLFKPCFSWKNAYFTVENNIYIEDNICRGLPRLPVGFNFICLSENIDVHEAQPNCLLACSLWYVIICGVAFNGELKL